MNGIYRWSEYPPMYGIWEIWEEAGRLKGRYVEGKEYPISPLYADGTVTADLEEWRDDSRWTEEDGFLNYAKSIRQPSAK